MRHITQQGLDLIKRFEGYSDTIYICPAGKPTIGYGHVVLGGEDFGSSISEDEAEEILRRDVADAERAVCDLIPGELTDGQFDALVSFTFNLGRGALRRSTLRQRVLAGKHDEATAEFGRWVNAGGKRLSGLVKRRAAEAELYQS